MARPASTYRAARRNAGNGIRLTVIRSDHPMQRSRLERMPEPRYVPYVCRPPVWKMQMGPDGLPVPVKVARRQPKTYYPKSIRLPRLEEPTNVGA